jgi:type II secretory pathway pseudopilin PulG
LIVVAIIAILAAIAIPNFLEAQTRSKVARALSDLRTLATGLEAFRTENQRYPYAVTFCAGRMDSIADYNAMSPEITTPVAWVGHLPGDIFNQNHAYKYLAPGKGFANGDPTILAIWVPHDFPSGDTSAEDVPYFSQAASPVKWALWSVGPAGPLSVFDSDSSHLPVPLRTWYDPSNGTVSPGIITRLSTGHGCH